MKALVAPPVRAKATKSSSSSFSTQKFSVQVGSFAAFNNAVTLKRELERSYEDIYITIFKTQTKTYYRVRIKTPSWEEAHIIAEKLTASGYSRIIFEEQ